MYKIFEKSELVHVIEVLKKDGKKVVFTNGCFDLLHVGHLRYLQDAQKLGCCLVVGLNTDESIRRIKGPSRPFVPEMERAEMLAGFSCVDYVVLFNEPTACELIEALKPNIYVKGGDYATKPQIPEAEVAASYGGEYIVLPIVEGKSTTNIVTKVISQLDAETTPAPSSNKIIGIIPARLAATRLPNKPLLDICGKPMIQWVYERASAARLDEVLVATPDDEILRRVEAFGGKAVMTSPDHRSGTDRLAEVAENIEANLIVNIQGDEPLLDPSTVDLLVQAMVESPDTPMGSLMCPLHAREEENPAVVKVVTDQAGFALYFSRSRIPYPRDPGASRPRKHIGIYAYRRDFLLKFAGMEPTPLEKTESLEQLRALENGFKIRMVETSFSPTSVDTPEDLDCVRAVLEQFKI